MSSSNQIKELAEYNAIYEFRKFKKIYGKNTDEYIRHFYNKLAELRAEMDCPCNCKHNHNSNSDEPCCRCDSRKTNAGRIRSMSDEDLAEMLAQWDNVEKNPSDWLEWLQSPVDDEVSETDNLEVRR